MKIRLLPILCFFAIALTAAEPVRPSLVCAAYTFRKETLWGAIEQAALCGIRHIETFTNLPLSPDDPTRVYELSDAQLERLRAHLAKHDVTIVSCMGAVSKDEKKARAFFAAAQRLGARNIGTDSVESIDTIEKIIGDYALTVAFHNHPADPKKPAYRNSDPHFMRALLAGRHKHIGVCADTGHYASSNVVPLDALKLLEGRIKSVHLKDRAAVGQRTPDQVYGTGVLDVPAMMAELHRQKFDGWIIIEYEANPGKNFDEVRQCADFVRAQLALTQP